jgi:hypothetical protein
MAIVIAGGMGFSEEVFLLGPKPDSVGSTVPQGLAFIDVDLGAYI